MDKYKNLEVQDLLKSELKNKQDEDKNNDKIKEEKKIQEDNKPKINNKELKEKKNIKISNNFKFEEISKEDALNQVLYISYNHNNNFISLGTLNGFKIFSLTKDKIELIYQFQYDPVEPIKIIEMLNTTQLLVLVGKNESKYLSPKKLTFFDLGKKKIIYSLKSFNSEIKLVRLNKKRLIIYADKTIFIYNLSNLKLLHMIKFEEDFINTEKSFFQGQICFSPNSEKNNYLVYSDNPLHGLIKIYDTLYLTYINFIQAHKRPLYKICINNNGNLIASCSRNNGSIKIFSLPSGEKIFKFKRGYTYNIITGMNFNIIGSNKLVISSGSGNIHIFELDKKNQNNEKEKVINYEGYLNKINNIYQKVTKECKDYLNNKYLTTTVNIKDLKGENLIFFKEGKGADKNNNINIVIITLEGFLFLISIDSVNYTINNIYKKYLDSIKSKK